MTKSSQWKKFEAFCLLEGHPPLSAALHTILAYLGYLYDEERVHEGSLSGYLSAVRTRHARAGYADPLYHPAVTKLTQAYSRADGASSSLSGCSYCPRP